MIGSAIKLAKRQGHKRYNHAAIIARGGSIFAIAINDGDGHAEANAFKKALHSTWATNLYGSTMYSIRLTVRGTLGMARPCIKCWEMLKSYGIKKVVYSNRKSGFDWERIK